ncbi:hypothetical protein LVD15_18175 [Fulvivirga maritima]|uniref:hypothetical protein n=1 Tax=Fulvivirga maritima TaxID=2904247 RepID=UPI001F49010E|nr:hypothetical protein [Fulvivirga maritima]UII25222.1 hypothetical protein LVD15_18175 [Fulvivirga maritima]
MEHLSNNWFTEGLVDYEYKKYVLLAYLKRATDSFEERKLYPFLSDLVVHYNNLIQFRESKRKFSNDMPKDITGIDKEKLELIYKQAENDHELLKEIENIIEFSLPRLKSSVAAGAEVYELVEGNCELTPIGLMPLYTNEGYMFISNNSKKTKIYRYELTMLETAKEKYRALNTYFVEAVQKGWGTTYESIKVSLTRRFKDLPNPATFLFYSKEKFPYNSTLEPVAKRLLVKYISKT